MRPLVSGALLCALLAACSAATPSASTSPSPSPPASATTVVTLQVGDEEYRIQLTDAADIAIAHRLLA
ncbi:MAG: hypothetical protein WD402_08115, partial [Chloroflexota bacterium]